jgi:vacuolar-type H+-ATPase subunit I/STV1
MGHNGKEGKIMVGDTITPKYIVPWDAHLQKELTNKVLMVLAVIFGIVSILVAYLLKS